jgi:hypothetical protein
VASLDNPTVLARLLLAKITALGGGGGGGVTDHGALTGLSDDDHSQYLLASGTRALTGPLATSSTFDGRDVATDGTKLDGVEPLAEVNSVDASDLSAGVLANARVQQSNITQHQGAIDHGSIAGLGDDDHTQYLLADGTRSLTGPLATSSTLDGRDVATDGTKLDTIATNADVTPGVFAASTNGLVPGPAPLASTSAYVLRGNGSWGLLLYTSDAGDLITGSLLDARVQQSNVTQHQGAIDHGSIAGLADDDHTQYLLADGTRSLSGPLATSSTIDGRDVATDGTKLDGIEALAEVNPPVVLGVWAGGKTSGTQAIGTLADATLDAEDIALSGVTLATNELTLANAGTYVITATLSYSKTTANSNCAIQLLLAHDLNLGAGYINPLRAFSSGHVRVSGTKGGCSMTKAIVTVTANEKIKFQHRDTMTGGNVNMDAQGLQVTVIRTA